MKKDAIRCHCVRDDDFLFFIFLHRYRWAFSEHRDGRNAFLFCSCECQ